MKIDDEVKVISRHLSLWKWFNAIGKIVKIYDDNVYKVRFQDLPDCFLDEVELAVVEKNKEWSE